MRVVHVIRSDGFAGVERHVSQLAAAQAERGDDVSIIGGDARRMNSSSGARLRRHLPAATLSQAIRALHHVRATTSMDVVHAHMTAAEVAAVVALAGSPIPIVATVHFAQPRGRNLPRRWVIAGLTRRIAAQIAISAYVADHASGKSVVIHPGVSNMPNAAPGRRRERVILVAQRLEPEKDTAVVLSAFVASGLQTRGWRLVIAGDGSQRVALEDLAQQYELGAHVAFLGQRDDVPALMDRSSILLAPCPVEGLGLTVLEAMAHGLPVVASAAGGHLETVGSVEGAALHRSGDVSDITRLMCELAAHEGRRAAYGQALQEAQRSRFTLAAQAEATDLVYRAVMR